MERFRLSEVNYINKNAYKIQKCIKNTNKFSKKVIVETLMTLPKTNL